MHESCMPHARLSAPAGAYSSAHKKKDARAHARACAHVCAPPDHDHLRDGCIQKGVNGAYGHTGTRGGGQMRPPAQPPRDPEPGAIRGVWGPAPSQHAQKGVPKWGPLGPQTPPGVKMGVPKWGTQNDPQMALPGTRDA